MIEKTNSLKKTAKENLFLILIMLLALGLGFTPYSFLGLILCLIAWSIIWPFSKKITSTTLRLIISFCLSSAFIQVTAIIIWKLGVAYTVPLVILLQLIFLLFVSITRRGSKNNSTPFMDKADLTSLLISTLTILVIGLGIFQQPLAQNLLRSTTNGFDDTIHTSLSLTVYNASGYVYGPDNKVINKVIYKALVAYPQGSYVTNTVWWHSLSAQVNPVASTQKLMLFYLLTKIFWLGLIVLLFSRIVLFFVKESREILHVTDYIGAMLLTILAELILFFGVFKFGFSSFMPVLALLLVLPLLLSSITSDHDEKAVWPSIIAALLISGGIAYCWLLAAPIGYIAITFAIGYKFDFNFRRIYAEIKKSLLLTASSLVLLLLGMGQLIIELLYNENVNLINNEGGIWPISMPIFGIGIVVVFVYLSYAKLKAIPLYLCLIPSLLLAGLVYAYQYISVEKPSYYSTKVGYLALIYILVLLSVLALLGMKHTTRKASILGISMLAAGIIAIPLTLGVNLSVINYMSGKHKILSTYSSSQIIDLLNKEGTNSNIIVDKNLDYEEDIITTNYLATLSRTQSACRSEIFWSQLTANNSGLTDKIKECASKMNSQNYFIISSSRNYNSLVSEFRESPNIKVILSN